MGTSIGAAISVAKNGDPFTVLENADLGLAISKSEIWVCGGGGVFPQHLTFVEIIWIGHIERVDRFATSVQTRHQNSLPRPTPICIAHRDAAVRIVAVGIRRTRQPA